MIWLDEKTSAGAAVEHVAEKAAETTAGASTMLERMKYYFDTGHLFEHVQDATFFEVPRFLFKDGHLPLPRLSSEPLLTIAGMPIISGKITKVAVVAVTKRHEFAPARERLPSGLGGGSTQSGPR